MHPGIIKKQFGLSLRDYILSLGMEPRPIGKRINGHAISTQGVP
jgi:hypothetical protein